MPFCSTYYVSALRHYYLNIRFHKAPVNSIRNKQMKKVKLVYLWLSLVLVACAPQSALADQAIVQEEKNRNLVAILDTIWTTEQEPIQMRDEMLDKHGADSEEYRKYQAIYKANHLINEEKIAAILANGWPDTAAIGANGNRTICNVLQHSSYEVRVKYLPLMKQAVIDQKLNPQLLVRAEDRIATDLGEPQIYGGQMKYYPETKSFNVWPVLDPVNIDKRRAEIGLGPIAGYLKNRFDFEWDLEEQIKRTEAFLKEGKNTAN